MHMLHAYMYASTCMRMRLSLWLPALRALPGLLLALPPCSAGLSGRVYTYRYMYERLIVWQTPNAARGEGECGPEFLDTDL